MPDEPTTAATTCKHPYAKGDITGRWTCMICGQSWRDMHGVRVYESPPTPPVPPPPALTLRVDDERARRLATMEWPILWKEDAADLLADRDTLLAEIARLRGELARTNKQAQPLV